MANNFQDILSTVVDEVKRPSPWPVGTYLWLITGQPNIQKIGTKQTDAVDVTLKYLQAQDDVDQTALAEAFPDGTSDKTIRLRFFLTPDAIWRLDEFCLEHVGLEPKTRGEWLAELAGHQVYGTVKHTVSQDGSQVFAQISSTAKV